VPLLRGRSLRAEPAFSHALAQRGNEDRLWSVRDGSWRLVWDAQTQSARLYDLASDPGETRNVANEHAAVCERLLALLNAQREQDAVFEQRVSGPVQTGAAPDARALEALGYTSTGERGAGSPRSKL
jgi:arylsulfatase A-like enzyme